MRTDVPAFEPLVQGILERGYSVLDRFLDTAEVDTLRREALQIMNQAGFRPAGVGQGSDYQQNRQIRSDYIHWIDTANLQEAARFYPERVEQLIVYLNRTCFLGIRDYEMHFAWYDTGRFYQRHLDVFRDDSARKLSIICYLNPYWQPGDGGELLIYLPREDGTEETITVEPVAGRLVCFESTRLEHEVLPAHQPRLSVTGWLKDEKRLF